MSATPPEAEVDREILTIFDKKRGEDESVRDWFEGVRNDAISRFQLSSHSDMLDFPPTLC